MITEPPHPPNNSHQGTKTKQKNPGERSCPKPNVADLSALHHPTGALLTVAAGTGAVAGTPGERGWCWWKCPGWQQLKKV